MESKSPKLRKRSTSDTSSEYQSDADITSRDVRPLVGGVGMIVLVIGFLVVTTAIVEYAVYKYNQLTPQRMLLEEEKAAFEERLERLFKERSLELRQSIGVRSFIDPGLTDQEEESSITTKTEDVLLQEEHKKERKYPDFVETMEELYGQHIIATDQNTTVLNTTVMNTSSEVESLSTSGLINTDEQECISFPDCSSEPPECVEEDVQQSLGDIEDVSASNTSTIFPAAQSPLPFEANDSLDTHRTEVGANDSFVDTQVYNESLKKETKAPSTSMLGKLFPWGRHSPPEGCAEVLHVGETLRAGETLHNRCPLSELTVPVSLRNCTPAFLHLTKEGEIILGEGGSFAEMSAVFWRMSEESAKKSFFLNSSTIHYLKEKVHSLFSFNYDNEDNENAEDVLEETDVETASAPFSWKRVVEYFQDKLTILKSIFLNQEQDVAYTSQLNTGPVLVLEENGALVLKNQMGQVTWRSLDNNYMTGGYIARVDTFGNLVVTLKDKIHWIHSLEKLKDYFGPSKTVVAQCI